MALVGTEQKVAGFVRDSDGTLVMTTAKAGAAMSVGFLRDPDGRLVVVSG